MDEGTGAYTKPRRMTNLLTLIIVVIILLVTALPVGAQHGGKVRRIGLLVNASPGPIAEPFQDELRAGLRDLGYVEGQNIIIERRWTEGRPDRLADLAADLVRLKVEVIVAATSTAARAAHGATRTIPIVLIAVGDPVGLGLAQSLARPGGNVTGLASYGPEMTAKLLQLLGEAVPRMKRLAIVWAAANPLHPQNLKDLAGPARSLDIRLQPLKVARPEDFEGAFRAAASDGAEAVWLLGDPLFNEHAARLATLALNARMPTIHFWRGHPEAGALMSYAPNWLHQWREAAEYVAKILRGAEAGELPIQQPTKFELVINLKTAKALGLTLPPALLLQADHLIE